MAKGRRLDTTGSKNREKAAWDKFIIPLIVTIVGGLVVTIVGGLILNSITHESVDPTSSSKDIIAGDHVSNNIAASDGDEFGNNITLDDSSHNGTIEGVTPNGAGTSPEDTDISEEMKEVLVSIQKLSTGSSKDWVDNRLGPPFASNIVEITENSRAYPDTDENSITGEILECVYLFDIVSVKIYFDIPDNSCKAFFVTLMEDTLDFDIVMPEAYSVFVSNKPLGEFTFSDIWDGEWPLNVDGYASNGVGRLFYGEQYYFAGGGNYQDFYFAVLDYGALNSFSEFNWFISEVQCDIVPGPGSSNGENVLSSSELLLEQRYKLYPNTYGISRLNVELTFSLFSSYSAFDSAALRKLDYS